PGTDGEGCRPLTLIESVPRIRSTRCTPPIGGGFDPNTAKRSKNRPCRAKVRSAKALPGAIPDQDRKSPGSSATGPERGPNPAQGHACANSCSEMRTSPG